MKKLLRLVIALCLLLIVIVSTSNAQIRVISGNVKDSASSKGMVGVSVHVKGTNAGTFTDQDGNYSLALPANATSLEFMFLGYKPVVVALGTSNTIEVSMQVDVLGLSQVVVTALGINEEKESLGYSAQTVGSDELNQSGTGNPLDELSGKVAGLNVITSSGDPDAGTFIQLRGDVSVSFNNQPLIVVDGIPLDNSLNNYDPENQFAGTSNNEGTLGGVVPDNRGIDINPNDIASITVLKGPAASALYGIKAATGAIIITTKKGNGGKKGPTIDFNTSESFQMVNKLPAEQMSFAQGNNGVYEGPSTGVRTSWGPAINTLSWTGVKNAWDPHGDIVPNGSDSAKIPVTPYNNQNEFFQTGWTEDNNIALSGGNDKNAYRFSIGNVNQTGVIPNTSNDKNTVSLNGQTALSSKLSASAGMTYITSNSDKAQQGSNETGVMLDVLRTPPTFDNANGLSNPVNNTAAYVLPYGFALLPADSGQRDYRGGIGYDNPFWTVNRNLFNQALNRVYGYGQIDYKPATWLDITYRLGGDVYTQDVKNSYDILSNGIYLGSGAVFLIDYFNKQLNSDLIATATHDFSKNLTGTLILGQNFFDQTNTEDFTEGTGLVIPHFFDLSNATSFVSSEGETEIRRNAWYGEAQLAYKNQLFLTATDRLEQSSTLPASDDIFDYYSGDVGWVFTEPLGLASNKIFPYGKLRLSYAEVGNDAPAEALKTYYTTGSFENGWGDQFVFPLSLDGNSLAGYQISSPITVLGNPDIKPEQTTSFEAGLDLAFLQNRVSLNYTFYDENTTNDILQSPVPFSTGYAAYLDNAANLTNLGNEVTLNITPVKQKNNGLRWDLTFNWSANKNRVVSLANGVNQVFIAGFSSGAIEAIPGEPFGEIYGTDYVKTAQGQLVIDDNKGDPGYGMPIAGTSDVPLGTIQPNWIGSITSTLSYKGFSLGIQLDVRNGGYIWDGTRGGMDYLGTGAATDNRGQEVEFSGVLGHVDPSSGAVVHNNPDGSISSGPGAANNITTTYSEYYWQFIGSSYGGPTVADVEPAGFVRIGQISLTYVFPKTIVQKMHLYGLSLTVFANNAFLWTKYPGVDPETSLTGPATGQGLDYFNNPDTKSFGLRLNVQL